MVYLLSSLLGAVFGLLGGYLGGMGGLRYLRSMLGEMDDEIEVLQKRLARREGMAAREKERATPKADINDEIRELLLMRSLQQSPSPMTATSPAAASRESLASAVRAVWKRANGEDE